MSAHLVTLRNTEFSLYSNGETTGRNKTENTAYPSTCQEPRVPCSLPVSDSSGRIGQGGPGHAHWSPVRTVTRQRATQAGVHRQAGDAWTVFKQTTRMFCKDFLWPCSQELSLPFLPFLFLPLGPPLPSLSPSLLSPRLPSPGATLPFILTPTQLPTITYHIHAHLTSACVCNTHMLTLHTTHRDMHTCLTSWLASSGQKVLFPAA